MKNNNCMSALCCGTVSARMRVLALAAGVVMSAGAQDTEATSARCHHQRGDRCRPCCTLDADR